MRVDPGQRVGEDRARVAARAPVGEAEEAGAVGQVDPQVSGPVGAGGGDRDLVAGQLAAEVGRFAQREAAVPAPADVADEAVPAGRIRELLGDQLDDPDARFELELTLRGRAPEPG